MARQSINLNKIPIDAYKAIWELDRQFVGTKNYLGVASFWCGEYKWVLREVSASVLIKVHHKMLKAGLALNEASPAHAEIVAWAETFVKT